MQQNARFSHTEKELAGQKLLMHTSSDSAEAHSDELWLTHAAAAEVCTVQCGKIENFPSLRKRNRLPHASNAECLKSV